MTYDVYVSGRRELLVVPASHPFPAGFGGFWRKKRRAVRVVSQTIREGIESRGYYYRPGLRKCRSS
ncbi:hypothetical protein D6B98_21950 [Bradyrhizobium sp. LVM 105]|nr:hypothetical protein D6B98_21950 [Bradyrhizobium sp. LVM 105]